MKITGIDHVTINVVVMKESIDFYENTLQLQKGDFVDMGDHVIQYFSMDDFSTLELIQYKYETEGFTNFLCKDPNGVEIEILER